MNNYNLMLNLNYKDNYKGEGRKMSIKDVIEKRRAYRALKPAEITQSLINELAQSASLAPSCFNYQPWRYVFVYDKDVLKQMFAAMSKNNDWTQRASMIIAVITKKELDCIIKGREYALFDTGMATALLILRATELGLVAHPIAGYDEQKVKEILGAPEDMTVITLVNVGQHSNEMNELMTEKQIADEKKRPERHPIEKFAYMNKYTAEQK